MIFNYFNTLNRLVRKRRKLSIKAVKLETEVEVWNHRFSKYKHSRLELAKRDKALVKLAGTRMEIRVVDEDISNILRKKGQEAVSLKIVDKNI